MAKITLFGSVVLLVMALALHLYFNVVYEAYYYPGRYETAFLATGLAIICAGLGLVGSVGAAVALRRNSGESEHRGIT